MGDPARTLPLLILLTVWQFGAPMVIFLAGLKQVPPELYEAASVDGAGPVRRFLSITIPMLSPVLFFNLLLETIHAFQVFNSAYIISNGSGGPAGSTLFYTLYLYLRGFRDFQMGYASAMAWVLVVAVGLVTLMLFRTSRAWVHYAGTNDDQHDHSDGAHHDRPVVAATRSRRRGRAGLAHARERNGLPRARDRRARRHPLPGGVDGDVVVQAGQRDHRLGESRAGDLLARQLRHGVRRDRGVSFWTFVVNSLILAVASVVGVVLSCSVTAYAFARIRFRGSKVFFLCMIATMLLPFHVVIIPQYIVFNQLDMINTYWPLLLGKFLAADAFFVFLMIQFIRGLPRDLDEAARIDGAGHARTFTAVILPLMRPALVTSSIFAFIWSWNDFFGPLLYLKDPGMYTMPLALRLYVDQTSTSDYGAQMAMAILALVPVVLFFLAFQRYLVAGVATEGLKG